METSLSNSTATLEQKQLQAMIDTACLGNPSLKDRITIASAWMLMKLPSSSLGWTREGEMTLEIRQMSVIMHLRLEALPGFKHILWMGNGFYATAAYWTYRVNREVKRASGLEFKPLTAEEKSMYGIGEGDLCCSVTQRVVLEGIEQFWQGTGIIGAEDLRKKDYKGNPLPGLQSTKDRMKTLKTRAVLDMYSRAYSIEGMTNAAEDMEGADEAARLKEPSEQATTIVEVNEKSFQAAEDESVVHARFHVLNKFQEKEDDGFAREYLEKELGVTYAQINSLSHSQLMAIYEVLNAIK